MSPILVTRRRLLSTVVAVGLAGCSGAPGGDTGGGADSGGDGTGFTDADGATETSADEVATDVPADGVSTDTSAGETATDAPTSATVTTEATATPVDGTGTPTADEELDLREANVVGVEFDGSSRFDVTLYHDDHGESGYANWWQVETLDGDRLGRRELLHAHGTRPFTRSASIAVPEGTTYVVVRGHDRTHGYGGQAMIVNLDTGATEPVRQGPEPRDFAGYEPHV